MRLADPVAGPYADNLAAALRSLQPPFSVSILNLTASEFRGVIVCENGTDDVKVGRALQQADIVSEIKKMDAAECKQVQAATVPFGSPYVRAGVLIFVGHRRLP
jgi:hypothetical protein